MAKSYNTRWYVVVNPHAGSKKTQEDWPEIRKLLKENGFEFTSIFTEYQYHATELTKKAILEDGFRKFIVIGGDGTLNEVINGVFKQEDIPTTDIIVSVISVGTGNDWGRMYNMPSSYKKQIEVIKKEKTFLQDIGKVNYLHHGKRKTHYFINIAGIGFDALVAKKTNIAKQKGASGILTYITSLITGLFQYDFNYVKIESEGKEIFSGKVFSVSIGICKYNGGGIMQLPNAIPDDGLFDITAIRKVSKFKVIRNLVNMYDGSFIKIKEVETFTGKEFRFTGVPENSIYLETDGESLGNSPLDFKILKKKAKMIIK